MAQEIKEGQKIGLGDYENELLMNCVLPDWHFRWVFVNDFVLYREINSIILVVFPS